MPRNFLQSHEFLGRKSTSQSSTHYELVGNSRTQEKAESIRHLVQLLIW